MKKLTYFLIAIGVLCFLLTSPSPSQAISILYEVTDLADTPQGQDLRQYSYTVSDYPFNMNYGFTIYFDYRLYANLEDPPPPVNVDWYPIVLQPDTQLPDDGMYDALALVNNASLADPFTVSFVWLGSGVPGSQAFKVYDPSFAELTSGRTAPAAAPVPEPSTLLLVGTGLVGIGGVRIRLRKRGR